MGWIDGGWSCTENVSGGYPHPKTAAVTVYAPTAYSTFKLREGAYPYADTSLAATVTRAPHVWSFAGVASPFLIDSTYSGYPHAGTPVDSRFPSADYRAAIKAATRQTRLTGTIRLKNGDSLPLTESIIASRSLTVSTNIMVDDSLLPGGTPSAELRVTLLADLSPEDIAGAEIAPVFSIKTRTGWYDVPLGVFTAALPEDDTGQGIAVTAYDDMHIIGGVSLTDIRLSRGTKYSAQEIITRCAEAAGVSYEGDVSEYINGTAEFDVLAADKRIETARDLLGFTAQALCSFAYVDRWRKLQIVPLIRPEEAAAEITEYQRTALRIARYPYRLYRLYVTESTTTDDGQTEVQRRVYQTLEPDGVEAELPENPLFPVSGQIGNELMREIFPVLDGLRAYPFTATIYGDPALEPFDWVTISGHGQSITAPVTQYEWRFRAGMTITCAGMDAVLGVARTMAEKATLATRISLTDADAEAARSAFLLQVAGYGHFGMKLARHQELGHFTHEELQKGEPS